MDDHLGNVRVVVSDRKLSTIDTAGNLTNFRAEVLSYSNYYAFGMLQPGRNFNSPDYRYGFNGQEKVDEIKGSGNHYTAPFWEYDPRAIHRWNMDPNFGRFPGWSPYTIMFDNPIWFRDPLGAQAENEEEEEEIKAIDLGELPSSEELEQRFGESFKQEFLQPLQEEFSGNIGFDIEGIEAIENKLLSTDFTNLLKDVEGEFNLRLVQYRIAGTDPERSIEYEEGEYTLGIVSELDIFGRVVDLQHQTLGVRVINPGIVELPEILTTVEGKKIIFAVVFEIGLTQ